MNEVKDFHYLISQVFDLSKCDMIGGFEVTQLKTINENTRFIHTFTVIPRIYPVEYAEQYQQQKIPVSYQATLSSKMMSIPFSFSYTRPDRFSTTIAYPLSKSSDFSINVVFPKNFLYTTSFRWTNKILSSIVTLNASDRLKQGSLTWNQTAFITPRLALSTIITKSLTSDESGKSYAIYFKPNAYEICASLNNQPDQPTTFSLGVANRSYDNTATGVSLFVNSKMESEVKIGFQRHFSMSHMECSISSKHAVQSLFQRVLRAGMTMTVSSFVDFKQDIYSFGIGMNLNDL